MKPTAKGKSSVEGQISDDEDNSWADELSDEISEVGINAEDGVGAPYDDYYGEEDYGEEVAVAQ